MMKATNVIACGLMTILTALIAMNEMHAPELLNELPDTSFWFFTLWFGLGAFVNLRKSG